MTLVNEDGVFKLQEPVPAALKSRPVLHVRVVEEDEAVTASDGDDESTGWNNLMALAGCLRDKDGATDVARNHDKYLYDK